MQRRIHPAIFFLLCVLFSGIYPELHAQRRGYVTLGTGTACYTGDLSDSWSNNELNPAFSVQGGLYINRRLSLRTGLSYGWVGASDEQANSQERRTRNLSFQSPVVELQGGIVWELLEDRDFRLRWKHVYHISPLVFAGVGGFYMNPSANVGAERVALQPLGTEGQFLSGHPTGPYSRIQVSVPAGVGLSIRLPNHMAIWAEAGFRKTFTDYLDDVSTTYAQPDALGEVSGPLAVQMANRSGEAFPAGAQRGNSNAKDGYGFVTISVGYFFGR